MGKVVGVRFKATGKVYDFNCGPYVLNVGDNVIVETEQGLGFGTVATMPMPIEERQTTAPLKKVFRLANKDDFSRREKNVQTEQQAHRFCQTCIDELGLKMNLFAVESTFDASKLTFFFTADGRVDFRQLVKMLVKEYRIRIEMRQVGIRNQAKMCGGIGRCGRELCCSAFIEKFDPISIRMAKEQSLSLNPTKISGLCGRLMCCLTFENDTYKCLKKALPSVGKMVVTSKGEGKVTRINAIAGGITIQLADGSEVEVKACEIKKKGEKEQSAKETNNALKETLPIDPPQTDSTPEPEMTPDNRSENANNKPNP